MSQQPYDMQRETYEIEKMSLCLELQRQIDSYTKFLESTPETEETQPMVAYARKAREAHIMLCAQINGLQYVEGSGS